MIVATTTVVRTADMIIANNKHFNKDNKVATRWLTQIHKDHKMTSITRMHGQQISLV